jgi:phytoene/squalene synthetase
MATLLPVLTLRRVLAERIFRRATPRISWLFRTDVTVAISRRDDLIGYCTYSAMPVGRFVLDVHGEDRRTGRLRRVGQRGVADHQSPAGLRKDTALDRVYIPPRDGTQRHEDRGARAERLLALRSCVRDLAARRGSAARGAVAMMIDDLRLALEVSVIHKLASTLVRLLMRRDPLSERVHLNKPEVAWVAAGAILAVLPRRAARRRASPQRKTQDV